MTLAIPTTIIKKPDTLKIPLFDESLYASGEKNSSRCKQEVVRATLCGRITQVFVLFILGILLACLLAMTVFGLNNVNRLGGSSSSRISDASVIYRGFCAVPIDDLLEQRQIKFQVKPIIHMPEPEVEVISTMAEEPSDKVAKVLNEELDLGDGLAKIMVAEGPGHLTTFLHDWTTNMTGIIDSTHCLVSGLDPSLSLPPALFAAHIARGSPFRVSRVLSRLRAVPDTSPLLSPSIRLYCKGKPVYQMAAEDDEDNNNNISKRSVRPAHYVHFAGQHVHEMEIVNMADVLAGKVAAV